MFKTINNDLDGIINKFGILDNSLADIINTYKNDRLKGVINIFSQSITDDDIHKIKEYNRLVGEEGVNSQSVWYQTMQSSSNAAKKLFENSTNLIQTENGAIISEETLTHAINQRTIATKVAAKALATLGSMLTMWALGKGIEFLITELDNAADSVADVEDRIRENQDALSDYTSKIEELTEKLQNLNKTDTTYLSDAEKKRLETETAYIESQLEHFSYWQ